MTAVPLHDAFPELHADLADGEHVTAAVAFLVVEDASHTGTQQLQVVASGGLSGIALRGLVELGRESLIADQKL